MKKAIFILGGVFVLYLMFSSGPSACDCYECYAHSGFGCGVDVTECIDKFGDAVPDSYRGTNRFSDKMEEILRNECEDWTDYHKPSELRSMGYRFDGNQWVR